MATEEANTGTLLILGGRSEIGLEIAKRLAPGRRVVLAARRSHDLGPQVEAITTAGAMSVHCMEFDADVTSDHETFVHAVSETHGPIATAIVAFGILGDQSLAERDAAHAAEIVHTDFVAQVSMLTVLANNMKAQRAGQLVVFSSVAGVRVRKANYVYGSAKAGLDGFASGLADALHGSGVQLLLVRPGFVVGRMTTGMTPAPFASTPEQVAKAVVDGLERDRAEVWVPGTLRLVYMMARLVPRSIWRRLPR